MLQTLTLSPQIFTRKVKYQNNDFSCCNTSKMSDNIKKCLEIVEDMMRLSGSILLNERQCNNLVANFQKGVEAIQKIKKGSPRDVFREVEQDLVRIVNKAKNVVDECCKEDWCHSAVLQIDNKETFRELLLDLECCFHTMRGISQMCYRGQSQNILQTQSCTTFYPTSIDEVEEDENSLHRRLSKHLTMDTIEDRALGQYLLERVTSLQLARGEELDRIVFPYKYPHSKPSGRLDIPLGTTGTIGCVVLPTKWEGIESATKVINVRDPQQKKFLLKEASILGGLNHPNIIKFFCCGFFYEKFEKFELVMERGKLDLCKLLDKEKATITDAVRMDIILQIASGMCYLHDMKVAHRALKPSKVVVTSMDVSKSDGCLEYVEVKLVGFSISKIEVKESPEVPTGQYVYGTLGYMAPEAFENRKSDVNAFKTDVFSFAMTSFEILTGEKPFGTMYRGMNEYMKLIHDGKRPKLPKNCSKELKSLIHDCWSLDPSKRPTFLDICNTLRLLKSAKFKNVISMDEMLHHREPSWSYDLLMNPKQWWSNFMGVIYNVFCQIFLLWQVFVTLTSWLPFMRKIGEYHTSPQDTRNDSSLHQILDKVNNTTIESKRLICIEDQILQLEGQLQKNGSLGIVGMGGIGKSTLANALSAHISHQFDGTCLVGDFKGETCTFIFKLEDMQEAPQVKKLVEARITMERICKTKKILIVVDDVSEHIDLHQLLGDQIFKDVNGSMLIASSRSRQSFRQYIPKAGIVNMKTLEGDKPMELFSMHAFGTDQSCEPYLKHIAEKIVNACNGLPLSLEVMGKCMHGERRLRIWERSLHRLLKARHDGGLDEQIWETLRISFDELGDREKNMFIDISCFFNQLDPYLLGFYFWGDDIIRMSDLDANIAQNILEILNSKSLVTVDGDGFLKIQDQLCAMGCKLANSGEFKEIRLIDLCLGTFIAHCKHKYIERVQGMSFERLEHKSTYEGSFEMEDMPNLQLLSVQNCDDVDVLFDILKHTIQLRWLKIHFSLQSDESIEQQKTFANNFWNIAQTFLHQICVLQIYNCDFLEFNPSSSFTFPCLKGISLRNCDNLENFIFEIDHMVVLDCLDIYNCQTFQNIPNGFGKLEYLKKIQIRKCEALEVFPSGLSNLTGLEELDLSKCRGLKHVPEGFGRLKCLKKLIMSECEALEEFPSGLSNLIALEELKFSKCRALRHVPEGFRMLTCLKKLIMSECETLEVFPSGLNNLIALEELNFSKCRALKHVWEGFGRLTCLKKLIMWECEALEEFPLGLSNLIALEELDFSKCRALKHVPKGFGKLTCLKKLDMSECEALEEFPSGLSKLIALEELEFSKCRALRHVSEEFGTLTCLKKLNMSECEALEVFPSGMNKLTGLKELDFSKCRALKYVPEGFGTLTCLKRLKMWECEALEVFPSGLNNLIALEELNFSKCRVLKHVPKGFGTLTCLKKLDMSECEFLEVFPYGLSNLIALGELDVYKCRALKHVPEGFGMLTCLKKLNMSECEALEVFPCGLNNLIALEELHFSKCRALKHIPEGFGTLTCLKKLFMSECEALEEFPSGLSNLIALEELHFSKCRALKHIPEGFGMLTCLRKLDMSECEALEEFPSGLSKLIALEELEFSKCRALRHVSKEFGTLTCLKKLNMSECEALEVFPSGMNKLTGLKELDFSKCRALEHVLEGFGMLTCLRKLDMSECEALVEFPSGLSNLIALEELDFSKCRALKHMPEGFEALTCLKKLAMSKCEALEVFPFGLNNLIALEELDF